MLLSLGEYAQDVAVLYHPYGVSNGLDIDIVPPDGEGARMAQEPLHEGVAVFRIFCHEPDVPLCKEAEDNGIEERRVVGHYDGRTLCGYVLKPCNLYRQECLQNRPCNRLKAQQRADFYPLRTTSSPVRAA